MFKIVKRNEKGFTLIELMIVIAIIGVLAAIAIPQFNAYRQKSFNSSAQSDVKNILVSEATCMQDNRVYDVIAAQLGPITGTIGPAATASTYGISSGVTLAVTCDANFASFVVVAKHTQGSREFGSDSDGTAIFWADRTATIGTPGITAVASTVNAVGANDFGAGWTAL